MTIKRCANCGKARQIHRRGLCQPCYRKFRASPDYTPGVGGGAYHVGMHPGSLRQIAETLGISHVTVRTALAKGRLVETEAGWQYTPGVPGRPKKAG